MVNMYFIKPHKIIISSKKSFLFIFASLFLSLNIYSKTEINNNLDSNKFKDIEDMLNHLSNETFKKAFNPCYFFISNSISLIPSAVNFCNLNSNIAST